MPDNSDLGQDEPLRNEGPLNGDDSDSVEPQEPTQEESYNIKVEGGTNNSGVKVEYDTNVIFDGDATLVLNNLARGTIENAQAIRKNAEAIESIAKLFLQSTGVNITGLTILSNGQGTGVSIKGE